MAKYKIDALDLMKEDIPLLRKLLKELVKEKGAGITIPLRARLHVDKDGEEWSDEWELSENWNTNQKVTRS